MNNNFRVESYIKEVRKGCKDNFHAFMVKNAEYDGYYDIPYIPQKTDLIIKKLVPYDKTSNHIYEQGEVVHFYLDDQKFDGPKGIWNGLSNNENYKRGFDLSRLNGASAIITPDFSLYLDMPRVMQIWNVYRSRAVGYYLTTLGYDVIPNVRWTDEESYNFAFAGLYKGQIVAVGTLGCSKSPNDKALLVNGFVEMIRRIEPRLVIVYGNICDELQYIIDKYNVKIIRFDSETALYFGGNAYGNEK